MTTENENDRLKTEIEALLILGDRPLETTEIAAAVERPEAETEAALAELVAEYDGAGAGTAPTRARGFELRHVALGWQLYVREGCEPVVRRMVESQAPLKLSQAALETLAVIAYKQPISRGQVASIRAVNVDSVVRTLLTHGLIVEHSIDEHTGATLFATTDELLVYLGIDSLDELPPISNLLPEESFDEVR